VPAYSVGDYAQIDPVKLPANEFVLGCWLPELFRGPARLQAIESVLCSLLSGEAWSYDEEKDDRFGLGSLLS